MILGILAQIARNWLTLRAVGVHPSILDSIAVLIITVGMSPLPVGAGTGATATVLILGSHGVAATAAGGVLLTATGTAGALCFATWACADHLLARRRARTAPALAPVIAIAMAAEGPRRRPAHVSLHVTPSRPTVRPLGAGGHGQVLTDDFPVIARSRVATM